MMLPIKISFSSKVHSIEAIKKAAYRFSDRITVEIIPNEDAIDCLLLPLDQCEEQNKIEIEAAFRIEVLDQDLRMTISAETAAIRNAVLAYAFSGTGLQEVE